MSLTDLNQRRLNLKLKTTVEDHYQLSQDYSPQKFRIRQVNQNEKLHQTYSNQGIRNLKYDICTSPEQKNQSQQAIKSPMQMQRTQNVVKRPQNDSRRSSSQHQFLIKKCTVQSPSKNMSQKGSFSDFEENYKSERKLVIPKLTSYSQLPGSVVKQLKNEQKKMSSLIFIQSNNEERKSQINDNTNQGEEHKNKEEKEAQNKQKIPLIQQNEEYQLFYQNLMSKIRQKHNRNSLQNQKTSESPVSQLLANKYQYSPDKNSQKKSQEEILVMSLIQDLQIILSEQLQVQNADLRKCFQFYCKGIQEDVFKECIIHLYTNALKQTYINTFEPKPRTFTFKIAMNIQYIIENLFSNVVLEQKYEQNEGIISRFQYFLNQIYLESQLSPTTFLEEIGGMENVYFLSKYFYEKMHFPNNVQMQQHQNINWQEIQEIGLFIVEENEQKIRKFSKEVQLKQNMLFNAKHIFFNMLYNDFIAEINEQQRKSYMLKFQEVKNKYFQFNFFGFVDENSIQSDIQKYFQTKKPLLEYFKEENKQKNVSSFVQYLIQCLLNQIPPSQISNFLNKISCKQIDESFFLMLQPLFIEPFKRINLGTVFLKNTDIKFYWMKIAFFLVPNLQDVLNKLDELLNIIQHWVDMMIQNKQLNKQQMNKINAYKNVDFLRYYLLHILQENLYEAEHIFLILSAFQAEQEVILFQLKGVKRALLQLKFGQNESFEIAEFLLKTFTESIQCAF